MVLDQVKGLPDELGQPSVGWAPRLLDVPCSLYPISTQGINRASLLKIQARWEIYLDATPLNPLTTRLRIGGADYQCRDVREWRGVTVVLAEEVV